MVLSPTKESQKRPALLTFVLTLYGRGERIGSEPLVLDR
jgi:hypothetical protein